jgi:isoquinoline 1-oxidoreductase alpha subunit
MRLVVNGVEHELNAEPDRSLLGVLRDELGLTGTKFSCGEGHCGACTVHVDGEATRSCMTYVSGLDGASVRTIEGLAEKGGKLHPVQEAFIEEQASQCGFCMSGHIMRAAALLEASPTASEAELVEGMSPGLCRCGSYQRIKRAVLSAQKKLTAQGARDE